MSDLGLHCLHMSFKKNALLTSHRCDSNVGKLPVNSVVLETGKIEGAVGDLGEIIEKLVESSDVDDKRRS